MTDFAIQAEKLGLNENVPTVLLREAFVSEGSSDVIERFGEYRHNLGRAFDLVDTNSDPITAPINIYAVTAVDQGAKKFTIDEEVAATITANAVDGTIRINASTGNDALYTIDTVTEVGGDTEIVVEETIATDDVDGNVFVGATPIQAQLRYVRQTNDAEFFLVATSYHIFRWVNSSKQLQVKFTSGSPGTGERWELQEHLDNIYATNNVDLVQKWTVSTSPSGSFENFQDGDGVDVDGVLFITKAKHLASFESYLFIGRVTYSDSSVHPQRVHWSSLGDTSDFDTTGAGDAGANDFTNTSGFLMGFGKWFNILVVFTTDLHYEGTLVTSAVVFRWDEGQLKIGALSADTIVNDKAGRLYWLANDLTIKEFNTPFDISEPTIKTLESVNEVAAEFAQATYLDEHKSIALAIPTGASTTNNIIVEFFIGTGSEYLHNIPVRSFGDFTRQETFSYDSPPFSLLGSYAAWSVAFGGVYDTNRSTQGFPLDMVSDYDGFLYEYNGALQDAGNDYTATLIFTTTLTLDKTLNARKRVNNGIHFYFNAKGAGEVAISIKRDSETSWQSLGTVSLIAAGKAVASPHLPTDFAFHFNLQIRLQSVADMEFLALTVREFNIEDDR